MIFANIDSRTVTRGSWEEPLKKCSFRIFKKRRNTPKDTYIPD